MDTELRCGHAGSKLFRMAMTISKVLSYSLLTDKKPFWNWNDSFLLFCLSIHHLNSPK